jgi:hypothetical protein
VEVVPLFLQEEWDEGVVKVEKFSVCVAMPLFWGTK